MRESSGHDDGSGRVGADLSWVCLGQWVGVGVCTGVWGSTSRFSGLETHDCYGLIVGFIIFSFLKKKKKKKRNRVWRVDPLEPNINQPWVDPPDTKIFGS
jgi:hypothetical protein